MKTLLKTTVIGLSTMLLLSGCIGLQLGGGSKVSQTPSKGQQLVDLQKAKECGAINETEFQEQKARLLGSK